ncbi:phosphopentomutase [Lentilitoribacter sp. EG35]|uniref:phosphopentomutase n=1 Tax=Lentilitoribacter sp. EG35 TaxID=3234192 RepID=UPI00345F7C75
MSRVFILILDSFGIGGAPDAKKFGDLGANTLGHIANNYQISLPNLEKLGLANAAQLATGKIPIGMKSASSPSGIYGAASEVSNGKDTPSGHWEIAGQPVDFDWGYFPKEVPCFPDNLTQAICEFLSVPDILANCHASGTDIIQRCGVEHIKTGQPICYTSSDSVFQIAAHEDIFGLEKLYGLCEFVRIELDPLNIGRVIARPFTGDSPQNFERTGNRRDFSVLPPSPTLLDIAKNAGRSVISIGKISDIYAHQGVTQTHKADGNMALFDKTLEIVAKAEEGSLTMTNFVDFDMVFGHRRDVEGYGKALEAFDKRLPEIQKQLRADDLVIITADHGCDPTWQGTDHTRERVPVLGFGPNIKSKNIGIRTSFADIGASAAEHLSLEPTVYGVSFL